MGGVSLLRAARLIRPSEADRQNKTAAPQKQMHAPKKLLILPVLFLLSAAGAPAATNDH